MAKRSQLLVGTIFDAFDPQTTSMEFNGVDEAMRDTTQRSHGIADVWSLMFWMRRRGDSVGLTTNNSIFLLTGGTPNRIHIRAFGTVTGDPVRVELHDTGGTVFKNFDWNSTTFPFDVWFQMLVIWNGAGAGTLSMYKDGSLVSPNTITTDTDNRAMANTNRGLQLGRNGGVQAFSGFIHSVAVWNADVAAGASTIYNSGVASSRDLSKNSGDYTFASNLQHWWRLGQDAADIGKDSGIGSPLIDVDFNSTNMDANDIDSESPL